MNIHPNSLANLIPPKPWKPGQSGNPAGRPPLGASVVEWLNVMASWPRKKIRAVLRDATAPVSKKLAAERLITGKGDDFDRVMDRTVGKPTQPVENLTPMSLAEMVEFCREVGIILPAHMLELPPGESIDPGPEAPSVPPIADSDAEAPVKPAKRRMMVDP